LLSCGKNNYGQNGNFEKLIDFNSKPEKVVFFDKKNTSSIYSGYRNTFVLTESTKKKKINLKIKSF
jgi:hypothetical protein